MVMMDLDGDHRPRADSSVVRGPMVDARRRGTRLPTPP